jgi:hypothetical protein
VRSPGDPALARGLAQKHVEREARRRKGGGAVADPPLG